MVVVQINGTELYIDGYLQKNLDFVIDRVINGNNMFICLIDGRVGSGKSTLGSQIGYYCSQGTLTLDHETFSIEQFEKALRGAQKGDAIILDESFEVLNKRTTQSSANMRILSLLQQMRAKQCFIILILPSVYDLDKNIILNLCDLFIHTYRKDFGTRGRYAVYSRHGLKKLWLYSRQSYSYPLKVAQPSFRARFSKNFPIGLKAYEKKKMATLENFSQEAKLEGGKYIRQRNGMIARLKKSGMPVPKIAELSDLKERQVYTIIEKVESQGGNNEATANE